MDSSMNPGQQLALTTTERALLQVSGHLRDRHAEVSRRLAETGTGTLPSPVGLRSEPEGPAAVLARLAAVRGRVAAVVIAIDDHLNAVDEEMTSFRGQLLTVTRDVEHSHETLAQHLDASESSIDHDWSTFCTEAAHLTQTVVELIGVQRDHHDAMVHGLHDFDGNVLAHVQAIGHDVESIVHRTENILQGAIQRLHLLHEQSRSHTRRAFIDDALSTLEHAGSGLLEALRHLHSGASEGARSVEESTSSVAATVQQIVQVVDTIRPVLEAVQALS